MPNESVDSRPLTGESQYLSAGGGLLSGDRFFKVVVLAFGYCVTGGLWLFLAISPRYATAGLAPFGVAFCRVPLGGPPRWAWHLAGGVFGHFLGSVSAAECGV